jgi:hypothetical protein
LYFSGRGMQVVDSKARDSFFDELPGSVND